MLRLGSDPMHAREMDLNDIFLARTRLLIVMAENYLDGHPLGEHRRRTMEKNADHIKLECQEMIRTPEWRQHVNGTECGATFHSTLMRLATMIEIVSKASRLGKFREKVMQEDLAAIKPPVEKNQKMESAAFQVAC